MATLWLSKWRYALTEKQSLRFPNRRHITRLIQSTWHKVEVNGGIACALRLVKNH